MSVIPNKYAPILPEVGLGGFILGTNQEEIAPFLHGVLPNYGFDGEVSYSVLGGIINLGFDAETHSLFRISAMHGYEGCLWEVVKIGMPMTVLARVGGDWRYEDFEGGFVTTKHYGVMIIPELADMSEFEAWNSNIGEISVFSQKFTTSRLD